MVVQYRSEKPNLSYVRINQNTSDGTGQSIKTYITKGLMASDPSVVNASLLHPSLVAQPIVKTTVETPFWGDQELPNELQDEVREGAKAGEAAAAAEVNGVGAPAPTNAAPATRPALQMVAPYRGETPNLSYVRNNHNSSESAAQSIKTHITKGLVATQHAPTIKDASHQSLTSVRLPKGAILVKVNPQQSPYPTHATPTSQLPAANGIKRKWDEAKTTEEGVNTVKFKRSEETKRIIIVNSRPDLIEENKRLEMRNKALAEENRELREKLDLLSKILKDPRKRDMLNARLARMQTASC